MPKRTEQNMLPALQSEFASSFLLFEYFLSQLSNILSKHTTIHTEKVQIQL